VHDEETTLQVNTETTQVSNADEIIERDEDRDFTMEFNYNEYEEYEEYE